MDEGVAGTVVRVRYTESMVRAAVCLFMRRAVLYRPWLLGLAVGAVAVGVSTGLVEGPTFLTGVFASVLGFAVLVPVVAWRSQLRHALGRYRQLEPAEAEFLFQDEALVVRSSLGSAVLPWAGFRACWAGEGFWVLAFKASGFVTLPTEGLSREVLGFVRGRVVGG